MQVQEKTRHIDATITGAGIDILRSLITQYMPEAVIIDDSDDDSSINWKDTELYREIKMQKTPGKLLQAYRERAGLSIMELAEKSGVKYTAISAMEHDQRVIGLAMAKRIATILHCDYAKFLNPGGD